MDNIFETYSIGKQVFINGHEDFASYYPVRHKKNNKMATLKIYSVNNSMNESKIQNEIKVNNKVGSSLGVVKLLKEGKNKVTDHNIGIESQNYYLFLQPVQRNLKEIIRIRMMNNNYFTKKELQTHLAQLIFTFSQIHSESVCHGQIEIERIFETEEGSQLLVGNFSFAQNLFSLENSGIIKLNQKELLKQKFLQRDQLESLMKGDTNYTINHYKIDVYHFGIVACQMASLTMFDNIIEFENSLPIIKRTIIQQYGESMYHLMELLLAPKSERKSFEQIYNSLDNIFNNNLSFINFFPTDIPYGEAELNLFKGDQVIQIVERANQRNRECSKSQFQRSPTYDEKEAWERSVQHLHESLNENKTLGEEEHNGINPNNDQSLFQEDEQQSIQQMHKKKSSKEEKYEKQGGILVNNNISQRHNCYSSNKIRNGIKLEKQISADEIEYERYCQTSKGQQKKQQFNEGYCQTPIGQEKKIQSKEGGNFFQQNPNQNFKKTVDCGFKPDSFMKNGSLSFEQLRSVAKKFQNLNFYSQDQIQQGQTFGKQGQKECNIAGKPPCMLKIYKKLDNNQICQFLSSLNDSNNLKSIVHKVEGILLKENEFQIIQTFQNNNLRNIIAQSLPKRQRLQIIQEIIKTVIDLHSKKIIHGALKPESILFIKDFNKDFAPCLTDLEFSQISSNDKTQLFPSRFKENGYSSPEQFNSQQICYNSDVWSLGIIFYELLTEIPINEKFILTHKLYDQVKRDSIDINLSDYPYDLTNLIKKMIKFDHEERISLQQLFNKLNQIYPQEKINYENLRKAKNQSEAVLPKLNQQEQFFQHYPQQQKQQCQYKQQQYQQQPQQYQFKQQYQSKQQCQQEEESIFNVSLNCKAPQNSKLKSLSQSMTLFENNQSINLSAQKQNLFIPLLQKQNSLNRKK